VGLQLHDFTRASLFFQLLKATKGGFSVQSFVEHCLVTLLFSEVGQLTDVLFLGVMLDQLEIALSVQKELLAICILFLLVFNSPLSFEHLAFFLNRLQLSISL
jgi:hypothetical protein